MGRFPGIHAGVVVTLAFVLEASSTDFTVEEFVVTHMSSPRLAVCEVFPTHSAHVTAGLTLASADVLVSTQMAVTLSDMFNTVSKLLNYDSY